MQRAAGELQRAACSGRLTSLRLFVCLFAGAAAAARRPEVRRAWRALRVVLGAARQDGERVLSRYSVSTHGGGQVPTVGTF